MHESLPRRDAVLDLLTSRARPLTVREMAARLQVSEGAYQGFVRYIESLAQEGALRPLDQDRYAVDGPPPPRKAKPDPRDYEGVLGVDPGGMSRLRAEGRGEDLLIPDRAAGGALHGDRVLARPVRRGPQGLEGEVLRVLGRARHRVGGTLRRRGVSSWLEPDDARVRGPIVLRGELHGRDGDAAVAQITRFPELPDENPEGELVAALGAAGGLRVEESKVLLREGIDEHLPAEAQAEAQRAWPEASGDELAGREDFTHLPLPTVGPDDALDHDAALWVERSDDGGYTAWVAVADASHHVAPGSACDEAARARGRSLSLPDREVPMLPPALSSGPCALQPGELRLCLCVVARLGPEGEVLEGRVTRGFLRSRARLGLAAAAAALGLAEGGPDPGLEPGLRAADSLAQALRAARLLRGSIDEGEPRPRAAHRDGLPTAIERGASDPGELRVFRLVDELTRLADQVAARFLVDRGLAAIFRVQPPPDPQKLEPFLALCAELGLGEADADPRRLAPLLRRAARHPRAAVLRHLFDRALPRPTYDVTSGGHFGLALPAYVHFTAPTRRRADLVVHRVIKAALDAEARGRGLLQGEADEALLADEARRATEREALALAVEREILDLHRAFLMRERLGETHEGTVTGVVGAGACVLLDGPFVEVQVRADAMGRDTYELDSETLRFSGRRSGDSLGLGDRVAVTIEEVALARRVIHAWRHTPDMADRAPLRHAPFLPATKKRATEPRKRR